MVDINADNDTGNSDNEKKVSVSGNVSVEFDNTGINNIASAIRNETTTDQQEENRLNNITERQANAQERGNSISTWAVIVSVFVFGGTLAVFFQNKKSVQAAIDASEAAQKTYGLAEKNFEIENTPYLQVYNISLQFHNKGVDTISFLVKSLGNYPIITTADIGYLRLYIMKTNQSLISDVDSTIFSIPPIKSKRYISKEAPLDMSQITFSDYLVGKTLDSIRNGYLSLILMGKIIYSNPVTAKPRAYIYQAQLNPVFSGGKITSKVQSFFTYNENLDIADTITFIVPKKQAEY